MRSVCLVFLLFLATVVYGQDGSRGGRGPHPSKEKMERIHAAKIAYITDRLHLTEDQSSRFIPLYNEYDKAIVDLRRSFKQKNGDLKGDMTNESEMEIIDNNLDYQEAVIKVKRDYNDRFLKIISPKQLSNLRVAEREFRQILIQRLRQQRRNGGGNWGNGGNSHNGDWNRY